jgi:aerobic C4-dicarboxylate transport protein
MNLSSAAAVSTDMKLPARKPFYRQLFFQILVAVCLGVLIGHFWPDLGSNLRPLGDGFIQLIKMIIAPLIFLVIVTGISAVGDVKAVGRVGVKALLYFTGATLFALVFGLIVGNVVQPGAGLNIDPTSLSQDALEAKTGTAPPKDAGQFLWVPLPPTASFRCSASRCFSVPRSWWWDGSAACRW